MHKIAEATSYIQQQCHFQPTFGIILGTGLGSLVDEIQIDHSICFNLSIFYSLTEYIIKFERMSI